MGSSDPCMRSGASGVLAALCGRGALALVVAFSLMLSGIVVVSVAPVAAAAECKGGDWSNLKWVDSSAIEGDAFVKKGGIANLTFDWKTKPGTQTADILEFVLPDELESATGGTFPLIDASRNLVVAQATWEGKKLVIKMGDFVDSKFNAGGTANVAVRWDRNHVHGGFDGAMRFGGCGTGSLKGQYGIDGPGGTSHDTIKQGQYTGFRMSAGGYESTWQIGISGNTNGGRAFTVVDEAPAGSTFVCDADQNDGQSPVMIYTLIDGRQNAHVIYDRDGHPSGGEYGVKNLPAGTVAPGPNFHVTCTDKKVTASFPRGVYANSSPTLQLRTVSKTRPEPGSIIKNVAVVNGKEYEGDAAVPYQGGEGYGENGGFTVLKTALGVGPDHEFTFRYECTPKPGVDAKPAKGTFTLKSTKDFHLGMLDKGLVCEVVEDVKVIDGVSPVTTWKLNGKPVDRVSFETRAGTEASVQVAATNFYQKPPAPPKLGTFAIKKVLKGSESESFKDTQFSFDYNCESPRGIITKGTTSVTGAGTVTVDKVPLGSTCTVVEKDVAKKEGVTWSHTVAPEEGVMVIDGVVNAITVTNTFERTPEPEPELGKFSIKKVLAGGVAERYGETDFVFDYTCVDAAGKSTKNTATITGQGEKVIDDIPVGSTCTVVEKDAPAEEGVTWTHTVEPAAGVRIDKDAHPVVTVTNTFERTPEPEPELGTFTVRKHIDGNLGHEYKDQKFDFSYTCGEKNGAFSITGAGTYTVENIPLGATCTVEEDAVETGHEANWSHTVEPAAGVLIEKDANPTVVVTNTFSGDAAVMPKEPEFDWRWVYVLVPIIAIGIGWVIKNFTPKPRGEWAATSSKPPAPRPEDKAKVAGVAKSAEVKAAEPKLANTGVSVRGVMLLALMSIIAALAVLIVARRRAL